MKKALLFIILAAVTAHFGCTKKANPDTTPPIISMEYEGAFPLPCDTVYAGQMFTVRAHLHDNYALGSFSIEIHNNFDHHNDGFPAGYCDLDSLKTPVNPFYFIDQYSVPEDLSEFETTINIDVPADVDLGDYHFILKVNDQQGLQAAIGENIKIEQKLDTFR